MLEAGHQSIQSNPIHPVATGKEISESINQSVQSSRMEWNIAWHLLSLDSSMTNLTALSTRTWRRMWLIKEMLSLSLSLSLSHLCLKNSVFVWLLSYWLLPETHLLFIYLFIYVVGLLYIGHIFFLFWVRNDAQKWNNKIVLNIQIFPLFLI
jgi:hypothetical protein